MSGTTITAHLDAGAAIFRTRLVRRLRVAVTDEVLSALADFLSAVNDRFRFARAVFVNDRLVVEHVVPVEVLTLLAIDRAVEALAISAAAAKRECAVLLSAELARQYLEFHKKEDN